MQKNMEMEELSGISGPPPTGKSICDWRASKEELERNDDFQGFKGQFGFKN